MAEEVRTGSAGPLERVRLFWLRVETRRSLEFMTSSHDFRFDADLTCLGVVAAEVLLTGVADLDLWTFLLPLEVSESMPLLDGVSSSSDSPSDALGDVIRSF